jgi:osmotically-inducible protein OsmY
MTNRNDQHNANSLNSEYPNSTGSAAADHKNGGGTNSGPYSPPYSSESNVTNVPDSAVTTTPNSPRIGSGSRVSYDGTNYVVSETTNAAASGQEELTNSVQGSGNGSTNIDADDTARNRSDRETGDAVAMDQGNSNADIETTARIRQAVVSGTNNFSQLAQNIKIITREGDVTLRGPVDTAGEKDAIVAVARSLAGPSNVVDQLEVKTNNP